MKAAEARKLYEECLKNRVKKDIVENTLNDIYTKVEKCARKGLRTLSYNLPKEEDCPINMETKLAITTELVSEGYKAFFKTLEDRDSQVDTNIIIVEW